MELINDFTVHAPIDEAYTTLTDIERIAPCLPGAQLTEVEGDVYRGLVKVKVGPITASFKGQASFVERDQEKHRAVLKADGRDTTGKGNASALITAQLEVVDPEVTKVTVTTDLTISGRVAQFGRGALADVSEKLLKQFVDNLETTVLHHSEGGAAAPAAAAPAAERTAASPGGAAAPTVTTAVDAPGTAGEQPAAVRTIDSEPVAPIDLLDTAGVPLAKRLLPVIGGLLLVVLAWRVLRRRS
jgi:carbon monoxide dehydrogenase subunit G